MTLVEREEPDALSMRRLGAQLGVEATALYHQFAAHDELLRAIGDRLLEPLLSPPPRLHLRRQHPARAGRRATLDADRRATAARLVEISS